MAYTKKTWVTGETIQAVDLNHLESGVEAISANGAINTANLADGAVTTAKLAANAVTSTKIANNSITEDELADGAVVTSNLADGAVTNAKIATAAVSGTQIADETITATNIADETLTEAKLDPTFAASLAKVDGSYEGMTVGNAEQLISTVGVEDNAPYTFRTTGGSADVGDRMNLKAVVGGTVAWNQLVHNGNFAESTGWSGRYATVSISGNVATMTPSSNGADRGIYAGGTYPSILANHVYLLMIDCNPSVSCGLNLSMAGGISYSLRHPISMTANAWNTCATLWKTANVGSYTTKLYALINNSLTTSTSVQFRNANAFDLTLAFGSTIADYIYNLEQTTTGAGVAYFRKLFPAPYYEYNAGELMSVQTSAHKMVGFNQLDVSRVRQGNETSTTTVNNVITNYYIPVVPNTAYYLKSIMCQGIYVTYYGADKNKLSQLTKYNVANFSFTTPNDAHYIRVMWYRNTGITPSQLAAVDPCINLSWDGERNGEYEPYQEWNYPLDSDLELRGIPKLDANNKLYYDGDTYESDGTVTRKRRRMVADGDTVKATSVSQSNGTYYCLLTQLSSANKAVNSTTTETRIITDKGYRDYPGVSVGHIYITSGVTPIICLFDQTLTTKEAVNTYLTSNPITIEYELDTPTTESADPYTELQICSDWGVEEFVDATYTAGNRDFEMPVGHDTIYSPNLRAKLEMSPNSPNSAGDFIVRQTDGANEYVPVSDNSIISGLSTRCPSCPTDTDGNFVLKAVVSSGSVTYSWVSA